MATRQWRVTRVLGGHKTTQNAAAVVRDKQWQKSTINKFSVNTMIQFGAKRPNLWTSKNWQLHHDNAPAHSSRLAKHGFPVIHQPPYFPSDFWLFPKLKTTFKGSCFKSREEIRQNATLEINTISKEVFQKSFCQRKDCGVWRHKESTLKGIRVPILSCK